LSAKENNNPSIAPFLAVFKRLRKILKSLQQKNVSLLDLKDFLMYPVVVTLMKPSSAADHRCKKRFFTFFIQGTFFICFLTFFYFANVFFYFLKTFIENTI